MTGYSHVLPFFTRRDHEGREQSVCGQFVTAADLAPAETLPTCWGCRIWVDNLDTIAPEPARVLARISPESPWGEDLTAIHSERGVC